MLHKDISVTLHHVVLLNTVCHTIIISNTLHQDAISMTFQDVISFLLITSFSLCHFQYSTTPFPLNYIIFPLYYDIITVTVHHDIISVVVESIHHLLHYILSFTLHNCHFHCLYHFHYIVMPFLSHYIMTLFLSHHDVFSIVLYNSHCYLISIASLKNNYHFEICSL